MSYWLERVSQLGTGGRTPTYAISPDNRPSAGVPQRAPEPPYDVQGRPAWEFWPASGQTAFWAREWRTPTWNTMMQVRNNAAFQRHMFTDRGLARIHNWQKSFLDFAFQTVEAIDWNQEREQWYQLARQTAVNEAMGGRIPEVDLSEAWQDASRSTLALVQGALARAFWQTRPLSQPIQTTIDNNLDQNAVAVGRRIGIAARPRQAPLDVDTTRTYSPGGMNIGTFIEVIDDDGEKAVDMPPIVIEQPTGPVEIPPCRIRRCDCPTPAAMQDAWFTHVQQYLLGN